MRQFADGLALEVKVDAFAEFSDSGDGQFCPLRVEGSVLSRQGTERRANEFID